MHGTSVYTIHYNVSNNNIKIKKGKSISKLWIEKKLSLKKLREYYDNNGNNLEVIKKNNTRK